MNFEDQSKAIDALQEVNKLFGMLQDGDALGAYRKLFVLMSEEGGWANVPATHAEYYRLDEYDLEYRSTAKDREVLLLPPRQKVGVGREVKGDEVIIREIEVEPNGVLYWEDEITPKQAACKVFDTPCGKTEKIVQQLGEK
jgi:hypothetical protein